MSAFDYAPCLRSAVGALLFAAAVACSDDPPVLPASTTADVNSVDLDAVSSAAPPSNRATDAINSDTDGLNAAASDVSAADGHPADGTSGSIPPFTPGPKPTQRLWPKAGEVWILQLGVNSLIPKMGEAALVVGPDGTIVVIDVGNDKHAKQVRKLVETLNTKHLTPAHGYPKRAKRQVEWLVLTHWHADHVGGAAELLAGDEKLAVTRGVVHRGWVDVGDATNDEHFVAVCKLLRGSLANLDAGLCVATKLPPCDLEGVDFAKDGHFPAKHCDGLARGELGNASDDHSGASAYLPIGSGARLTILAADAWLGGGEIVSTKTKGWSESNQENARSLVGLISHGAFRYHFGGDLTGAGTKESPDIETPLAKHVGPKHWHNRGVDVVHSHHHARKTSNNLVLADALAPKDGRSRNVVAGVSKLHIGSPQDVVVKRWTAGGRLGKGKFWTTHTTFTSAKPKDFPAIIEGDGDVVTRTVQEGAGYWMQAPETGVALAFESVRYSP